MPAASPVRPCRLRLGLVSLLAAGAVLAGASCTPDDPPPPPTEVPAGAVNVLQAVHVEMRPDASIVGVTSEAMAEPPGEVKPTLVRNDYSPADVAQDLPIRVTTTYRTATGQGTNLVDLAGYTGRVEISLAVQNLTVAPKTISYDAGGTRIEEQVLVGSPWTVFASTALPNVAPSSVVMSNGQEDDPATNGVLAQLPDGSTSVQWASLLLSPSSMSGTTMTLVMDVTDMAVPEFELSAHPGVVGDPRASFMNSSTESETALLQRTVALAGEVQVVLDDVGESIADMRKSLETSTTTFGADAVKGLKETNTRVESSTQVLVDSLDRLQTDVGTLMESSQSALVGTLEQSVSSMQAMLGDPSQMRPEPVPLSSGCEVTSTPMTGGSTVAGLIGQMSSQLDQYANAAEECRDVVRDAMLAAIGPEDPTEAGACPAPIPDDQIDPDNPPPLTCALWDARVSAQADLTGLFAQEREALLDVLDPQAVVDAKATQQQLVTALEEISTKLGELENGVATPEFTEVQTALTGLTTKLTEADTWMTEQHTLATQQQRNTGSMITQNRETAQSVCSLIRDADNPSEDLIKVYASLSSEPCQLANGSALKVPDHLVTESMQAQLADQQTAWDIIAAETAPKEPDAAGRVLLRELKEGVALVEQRLQELVVTSDGNDGTRAAARQALAEAVEAATTTNTSLGVSLESVDATQTKLREDLAAAFANATDTVNGRLQNTIDPMIRQVRDEGERTAGMMEGSMDRSTSGMRGLSDDLLRNGQETLAGRSQALQEAGQASSDYVTQHLGGAGTYLSEGLGGSARDIEGARAPLIQDLQNALADLGSPETDGGGLLGSLATSSAAAATTDEQVALANSAATSFANVRIEDIGSIAKGHATFRAGLAALESLPLFQLRAEGATHTTVYVVHVRPE